MRKLPAAMVNPIPITKTRINPAQLEDYLEPGDPKVKSQIRQSNSDIRAGRTRPAGELLHELVASSAKPSRRRVK
jgi:hypothetical protein